MQLLNMPGYRIYVSLLLFIFIFFFPYSKYMQNNNIFTNQINTVIAQENSERKPVNNDCISDAKKATTEFASSKEPFLLKLLVEDATDSITKLNTSLNAIIASDENNATKHSEFWMCVGDAVPELLNKLSCLQRCINSIKEPAITTREEKDFIPLNSAVTLLERLVAMPRIVPPKCEGIEPETCGYALDMSTHVMDRYWIFYHLTEILGAYNRDQNYTHIFAHAGRASFLNEEIGACTIEMLMDWWMVPTAIWRDETVSDEEKLMSTKYAMWQNERWGGREHYVNAYWSWEPAFKDEDCALFTGNFLAALAAEYSFTQHPRTLKRMRAMVDAIRHFDRLKDDGIEPLEIEEMDGRIQRGPKTKNYYTALDSTVFRVSIDNEGFHTHHHTRIADTTTGRERANVSRDQYYGVLTGYYVLYKVLSELEERNDTEQQLLADVIEHCALIAAYLDGSRIHPGFGPAYNLYALFEGSCANPPNLSFMGAAAFAGLGEITGRCYLSEIVKLPLYKAVLDLGILVESLDLTQRLLKPARTSFTTLNQVLAAFIMSNMSKRHWEFYFAPEYLMQATEKEQKMWRRVIGAYLFKFGSFGNSAYRHVMENMLLSSENDIPATIEMFFNRYDNEFSVIEPQYKVEEFMWPLTMMIAASDNKESLGAIMLDYYDALLNSGRISFCGTDLIP